MFALNVVIGLGLGLAIDYSLFVVSRYREELSKLGSDGSGPAGLRTRSGRRSRPPGARSSTAHADVALAIATLCSVPMPFMFSMGLGGAITALVAVTSSLMALPAVLGCARAADQRGRSRQLATCAGTELHANVQDGPLVPAHRGSS